MELQGNQKNIISWVIVVGFLIAVYKLLTVFGVFKTADEKSAEQLGEDLGGKGDKFVQDAVKAAKTPTVLKRSVSDSKTIAKMITTLKEAPKVWWLPDEEIKVYAVFRQLKSKADMGLLSATFKVIQKIDLFDYLEQFMDSEQLAKVNGIVQKLPKTL
jgi:hypothetical protein